MPPTIDPSPVSSPVQPHHKNRLTLIVIAVLVVVLIVVGVVFAYTKKSPAPSETTNVLPSTSSENQGIAMETIKVPFCQEVAAYYKRDAKSFYIFRYASGYDEDGAYDEYNHPVTSITTVDFSAVSSVVYEASVLRGLIEEDGGEYKPQTMPIKDWINDNVLPLPRLLPPLYQVSFDHVGCAPGGTEIRGNFNEEGMFVAKEISEWGQ